MVKSQSKNRKIYFTNKKNNQAYNSNPIIQGYFPKYKTYKELAIARVNKGLTALLALSMIATFISYYFVVISETKLNHLRRDTIALTDKNVELQNELDRLHSYTNVDNTMQKKNLLQKADKTIEVEETKVPVMVNKDSKFDRYNLVWSMGY